MALAGGKERGRRPSDTIPNFILSLIRMIIFDLICCNEHRFEGWFQSQENFDSQLQKGLVTCPFCESVEIRRVPSAVHLSKSSPAADTCSKPTAAISPQGEMLGDYQKLLSTILANCEDVGAQFADEARRMHYKEIPARSIRGQASEDEFKSLHEEGIDVVRLPTVKKEKLN